MLAVAAPEVPVAWGRQRRAAMARSGPDRMDAEVVAADRTGLRLLQPPLVQAVGIMEREGEARLLFLRRRETAHLAQEFRV